MTPPPDDGSTGGTWLSQDLSSAAVERILDAVGRLSATHGLRGVRMESVAAEAGCSRATVYRYFDNRQALQSAFANREALRVVEQVTRSVRGYADPRERAVHAVVEVIAMIRANPTLSAWAGPDNAAEMASLMADSELISHVTTAFTGSTDPDLGRWIVRIILSLLAVPATDPAEEQVLIERFLVPLLPVAHLT